MSQALTLEQTKPLYEESVSFMVAPTVRVHVFVWPEAPLLANRERTLHHAVRAKWIAHWRDAFRQMADGCQRLESCEVVVAHETRTRRRADAVACAPSYKAALDGVRIGGVIDDDDPEHVRLVSFLPPAYTGRDALTLIITGRPA